MDEARAMLAVAVRAAVGGAAEVDIIDRVIIKGISQRQCATEDEVHRDTIGRVIDRFREVEAAMAKAAREV